MIEFHLDSRSGVSPYLQIVQQVRQALRVGMLREGDQLPTVKEVVGQLAINPNTVLKAYRELEHEGLASARPGVGTFVTGSLGAESIAAQGPLRQALQRWIVKARRAGLDDESIEALFRDSFRSSCRGGHSVSWVIDAQGLGKRYGRRWALKDCDLQIPSGHVVGLVGPNGAGKTTLLHLAVGLLAPTAGTMTVLGRPPAADPAQLARVGFVAQDTPTYARLSVEDHLRFGSADEPGLGRRAGRGNASRSSTSISTRRPARSRAASGRSSPSPWRWPSDPSCSSSTSRWPASTRWPAGSSCKG